MQNNPGFRTGNVMPHYEYYLHLLEDCISSKSLRNGKLIYQNLIKNPHFNSSIPLLHSATKLFISCNKPELARRVFSSIPIPDRQKESTLWNQLIRAYAWEGPFEKAIHLYHEMVDFGAKPTNYTYPVVLKACAALQDVENGVRIHGDAKRNGFGSDVYICTALVDFYVKCGCLMEAREVFDEMPERDVVAWNALISGFSSQGLYGDVIELVLEMQGKGLSLNSSTLVTILPVIGEANELAVGKAVHGLCVRRGLDGGVAIGTGLLDMYGKCGMLGYARKVFHGMSFKNEITWSAVIGACISCDCTMEGLEFFRQMRLENAGHPSAITLSTVIRGSAKIIDLRVGKQMHSYSVKMGCFQDFMVANTFLSLYAKCNAIEDAVNFFEEMVSKDSVSYSALISGCVQNGSAELALKIFRQMQVAGVKPESATMMGFLPACSYLAMLRFGQCAHCWCVVHGFTADLSISNALIDMYSKCGKIHKARTVFDRMHKRDVVSWNAMIIGYGIHGLGLEAISLFHRMQCVGQKPDEVTFIGILSACSHSGLVEEGMKMFDSIKKVFFIEPRIDHYLCIVDLLGRSGRLDETYRFIQEMPLEPDSRIWNAFLSACRIYRRTDLVEEISTKIQSSESSGNFVLLSNIYSTAGRWDDAADVRVLQRGLGIKKSPGSSSIH